MDQPTSTADKPERRPKVEYSDAMVDRMCERIGKGLSLRQVCKRRGMPHFVTFLSWVAKMPAVEAKYAEAMRMRAEWHADGIIKLADEKPEYVTTTDENGATTTRIDPAWVNRQRLRIDARKWAAAKLYPKKYGERVLAEVTGKDGKPIEYRDVGEMSDAQLEQIAAAAVSPQSPKPETTH